MAHKNYVVHTVTYGSLAVAKMDLEALRRIKSDGEICDLTAAIVSRSDKGRLKVREVTHTDKVAAGGGIMGGGVVLCAAGRFSGDVLPQAMQVFGETTVNPVAVQASDTNVAKALSRAEKKPPRRIDRSACDAALRDLEQGTGKAESIAGL